MKQLKRLLTPTISELTLYGIISAVLLALVNLKFILNIPLLESNPDASVGSVFHQYADQTFFNINQTDSIGRLTNVLIWAGVGALSYIILWGVLGLITGVHNEFVMETKYTEIGRDHKKSFLSSELSRGIFRGSAFLLILLLTSFAVQVLIPASAQMVRLWIGHPGSLQNCLYAFVGFVDIVVLLYVYAILFRLLFMRTRVFS